MGRSKERRGGRRQGGAPRTQECASLVQALLLVGGDGAVGGGVGLYMARKGRRGVDNELHLSRWPESARLFVYDTTVWVPSHPGMETVLSRFVELGTFSALSARLVGEKYCLRFGTSSTSHQTWYKSCGKRSCLQLFH